MPRARKIETRMQDAKAVELRRRGLSYEQIAETLSFSAKSAAFQVVQLGRELADNDDHAPAGTGAA